jgi:hypothetical protein
VQVSQGLKPGILSALYGTTKVVPFPNLRLRILAAVYVCLVVDQVGDGGGDATLVVP